ncbi:universal stress protein [Actinomadura rayongensis]|uniref:Universal stress protein n=1 Tax=Actinomadura rayongensis TaxID=1429076 RepID=A0A6I4W447_9ACTN|nr:universal stress protein [Actinomadura rayongensis]MXQ64191.1 universal stress protein [Actinomadura rayongensis]
MAGNEHRPVLVGTDGSPGGARAVEWAADDAARRGRELHVLYADGEWPMGVESPPDRPEGRELGDGRTKVIEEARAIAAHRQPGLSVSGEALTADPVRALLAESPRAFETVIGSRGLGGFAGMMLGSVALRVAGRAAGPVVVVRGEKPPEGGHHEVIAGVDLSERTHDVLEYAYEAAELRGARLRIVCGFHAAPSLVASGRFVDIDGVEDSLRAQMSDVRREFGEQRPKVDVVDVLVRDHPVHALAERSHEADLVVVGARGLGRMRSMLLGSISHGVLHHAHCPVAVVTSRTEPYE